MDDASESPGLKIRLRRDMDRAIALWREYWQFKWFRITAYVVGAILLGWLVLGEHLSAWEVAGIAVTIMGVWLVNQGYRKEL